MTFDSPPLFKRRGLMLDISRNRVPTKHLDPEITLGVDLSLHALERCLDIPSTESRDRLKERFAEQWLRRSRPGGLRESLELM